MDFLTHIWRLWNDEVGTSLVGILALIALLKATGKDITQLVSAVWRWKVWTLVRKLYGHSITKYRLLRAKKLIQSKLERETISIRIRSYVSCLQEDPRHSTRSQLKEITPHKPTWLNDFLVASALESLSADGKVAKAIRYSPNSWPPEPERYQFLTFNDNQSAQEIATLIETNDKCLIFQRGAGCARPPRFEARSSAETVSTRETRFTSSFPLVDSAPPCELCWLKESRERDTRNLVESFVKHDFANEANVAVTGANGELQEVLVSLFLECEFEPEVRLLKPLVKQAINFRQEQISARSSGLQEDWQPDDKRELTATLLEQIKSQSN